MKKILTIVILFSIAFSLSAQIVSLSPANAAANDEATLIFKANEGNGELIGADKVYLHHGVVINSSTGTDWNYVIGNWGQDDGVGEMHPVSGEEDTWEITFSPSIREYFGVPSDENIFRISAVFRNAGDTKGTITPGEYGWGTVTANGDFYINLNSDPFITLNRPVNPESFIKQGETIAISATASSEVTDMKIFIDEGDGYIEKQSITSGIDISYLYTPNASVDLKIKITAIINGKALEVEKTHNIIVISTSNEAALPDGLVRGINYSTDATKVTLVLEAPGKDFVYVVGDFSDWKVKSEYQMNVTPDGEIFWLELTGIEAQKEYVFQYWIDGEIRVGDPYADKVADPWNDKYIEPEIYPNVPEYNKTENGIATVLQTGQQPYIWGIEEDSWERPDIDHLVIYELHLRDFIADHNYKTLADTLTYLSELGIDAIELMPVSEFEGNDSWGYNPSYYFAPDKYYGTKNDLKKFIEEAHKQGMAVIIDMVLNHAYRQNPMVKMYFNDGKPASNNPWFNQEHVGPYAWGYDFNHESTYTQAFVDRVNKYWVEEFHFDGFRFDFTKGFTNYESGGSIDGFDQSRIDILERMADKIWEKNPDTYVILEHWGPKDEEQELGAYGMKMWSNRSYDFVPAVTGNTSGSFNGLNATTHVIYFDSHDESRIAEHALNEGLLYKTYNIKDTVIMCERVKMAAAFNLLNPGPKMIWQFDELGYDVDIDYNGRLGQKPRPWGEGSLGYYDNQLRQNIYDAYSGILKVRYLVGPDNLLSSVTDHKLTGNTRRLTYDTPDTDLVLVGNFGLNEEVLATNFSHAGTWYDYFSGEEKNVSDISEQLTLQPGEWHIFTSQKLTNGLPGVVEVFQSPISVTPYPFAKDDEITITFDATKASAKGTQGLIGADKVYMHSGVTFIPNSKTLSNIVSNNFDAGVGEMVKISDDKWQITLTPSEYYSLNDKNLIYKIGMYFSDANHEEFGYGFRDEMIYLDVKSNEPIITIEPAAFNADEEITITFNANLGNAELSNANKVYMHSGVSTVDNGNPVANAWSHVVGNYGMDDGVGEMSVVENMPGYWQIKMTPQSYYGLADEDKVYWLAFVFRNADGSVKGTATAGEIENGFIEEGSLDYFIKNQKNFVAVNSNELSHVRLYPNPAKSKLFIDGLKGEAVFTLYHLNGQMIYKKAIVNSASINILNLKAGMYIYQITTNTEATNGRIVKH